MRIEDFGHFDAPVVLFGGPYSNAQALEALISAIDGRAAICTGDIVAYCADPDATAALLSAEEIPSIAGNCERQLWDDADSCGCGFEEGSTCDRLSAGWWPYLRNTIDGNTIAWLNKLPDIATFTQGTRRYGVIHGGATTNNRFLWPSTPACDFETEITALEALTGPLDGIIAGHSGIAFHRRIGAHQWINAGAIGLPPHDGRPETRYALLEDGEVTIHRLAYDHKAARRAMEAAGLTQGYHDTLTTGLWPSQDILPPELRR